jgi:hypothetical protein
MHRTEADGHVSNLFDPGDPFIPRPATQLTYDWCNAVQEELALTIEGLGGTLNTASTDTTPNQLLGRLNAKYGRLDYVSNAWTGSATIGGTLGVTGNTSLGGSLSVTASTTLTGPATLNGTTTVNAALLVGPTGGGNVTGATLTGSGTGYGAVITSGASGDGATITALGSSATGVIVTGGPGGIALRARAGTAASATIPTYDVACMRGYIVFDDAVAKPNSNVALKNALTPANIVKAWVTFTAGASGPTVLDGCNITSVVNQTADAVRVTFAQAFANAYYACSYDTDNSGYEPRSQTKTATYVDVIAKNNSGTIASIGSGAAVGVTFSLTVCGRQ